MKSSKILKKRKFYSVLVCKTGEDYCFENLHRILDGPYFVFGEDTIQRGPYEQVNPGDILLLSYKNYYVAYGRAIGLRTSDDEDWNQFIDVDRWVLHNPTNPEIGIGTYGISWHTLSGSRSVVKEIEAPWAIGKLSEINEADNLLKIIKAEFADMKEKEQLSKLIDLLKGLKPQIILQGPPGTGKTRLAKLLAKQLAAGAEIKEPMKLIDDFFIGFDPKEDSNANRNTKVDDLLKQFYSRFPKENLVDISLEEYSYGRGNRDNFCWWLEEGLKLLGGFSPGNSSRYLLYWNNKVNAYVKSGEVHNDTDEDAIKKIGGFLAELANNNNPSEDGPLVRSLQLKILSTYYPDEYFPITALNPIDVALSLCGKYDNTLDIFGKNRKLMGFFKEKRDSLNQGVKAINFMQFLFGNFNLKAGVLYNGEKAEIGKGDYKLVQFHPSYSYEDFVRGISAIPKNSGIVYKTENKILIELAQIAIDNPSGNYVLIIDEINRANLPSVLGELIYALEYRYDENNEEDTSVESIYGYDEGDGEDGSRTLRLPKNLFVIGTMNTADRSVGHIDYAIRRRFAFANVLPNEEVIEDSTAKALFKEMKSLFVKSGEEGTSYLSPDFEPYDVLLGHSYFLAENKEQLRLKLEYEILPLLKEYVRDGILTDLPKEKIKSLNDILL